MMEFIIHIFIIEQAIINNAKAQNSKIINSKHIDYFFLYKIYTKKNKFGIIIIIVVQQNGVLVYEEF